jgi:hypothetical protein
MGLANEMRCRGNQRKIWMATLKRLRRRLKPAFAVSSHDGRNSREVTGNSVLQALAYGGKEQASWRNRAFEHLRLLFRL